QSPIRWLERVVSVDPVLIVGGFPVARQEAEHDAAGAGRAQRAEGKTCETQPFARMQRQRAQMRSQCQAELHETDLADRDVAQLEASGSGQGIEAQAEHPMRQSDDALHAPTSPHRKRKALLLIEAAAAVDVEPRTQPLSVRFGRKG